LLSVSSSCAMFASRDTSSEEEQVVPGFQSEPMKYILNEMPADSDLDKFIASW